MSRNPARIIPLAAFLALGIGLAAVPADAREISPFEAMANSDAFPITLTQIEMACTKPKADIKECVRLNANAREAASPAWKVASADQRKACYPTILFSRGSILMDGSLWIYDCLQKAGLAPVR